MKSAGTTAFKSQRGWGTLAAALTVVATMTASCSQPVEGPTQADADKMSQQQFDRQIQTIQNDPSKSPEAKQKAIAIIKSQQAASGKTTP